VIIDRLEESERYAGFHPLFPAAFEALRKRDLAALGAGTYPIDGERVYLVIAIGDGSGTSGAVLEAHRKYIDIQYVIEGTDMIGWRPLGDCAEVMKPYDGAKDVILFGERPLAWSPVAGSRFAVYFPADAHAPLGGTGPLRRAIVKVGI
jgi:biofilm protein TabA